MRVALFIVALLACGTTEPSYPQTNFDLLRGDPAARLMGLPYGTHADALVDTCCPRVKRDGPLPRETAAVCCELQRTIEQDPTESAFFWGPHCQTAIPVESLRSMVARDHRGGAWYGAVSRLAERDPTEATQRFLFRELVETAPNAIPGDAAELDRDGSERLVVALATGGEAELRITADALVSKNPRERLWAANVFLYATSLPLDLPEVLPVLDELGNDPDARIAEPARQAAAQYRSWSDADLELSAGHAAGIQLPTGGRRSPFHPTVRALQWQDILGQQLAIQAFSRRRAFCSSRVATAVLATMKNDGDVRIADLANRATKLRTHRCAGSAM